jgi:hypothetical protein
MPRTTTWIRLLAIAITCLAPLGAFAFMQAIPEELTSKSEEEKLRWLNSEFEQAYTLQLQVAKERYEEKMARKDTVLQTLADKAFEREKLITEAQEETRRELAQAARETDLAFGGAAICLALLGGLAWWQWGRRVTVEVDSDASVSRAERARAEIRETLEALEASRKSSTPRRPPRT